MSFSISLLQLLNCKNCSTNGLTGSCSTNVCRFPQKTYTQVIVLCHWNLGSSWQMTFLVWKVSLLNTVKEVQQAWGNSDDREHILFNLICKIIFQNNFLSYRFVLYARSPWSKENGSHLSHGNQQDKWVATSWKYIFHSLNYSTRNSPD